MQNIIEQIKLKFTEDFIIKRRARYKHSCHSLSQNDKVLKTLALLLIYFSHRINWLFYRKTIYWNSYYSRNLATDSWN